MDNGSTAPRNWIAKNAERFFRERYTTEDIARLALAAGFLYSAVETWKMSETSRKFRKVA